MPVSVKQITIGGVEKQYPVSGTWICPALGTLRVGDMYTSSDIFDSVRFRGVRLFRDMQMLPNSKQNFTPRVQGIAQSNALVTIEQNGFVVYQKEVPPARLRLQICSYRWWSRS